MLIYFQTSDILYYEVLDIPLPELQGLKTLKVAFHHATKDEVSMATWFSYGSHNFFFPTNCHISLFFNQVVIHTIRLPKQSTVGDVLDDLKTKVGWLSICLAKYLQCTCKYKGSNQWVS